MEAKLMSLAGLPVTACLLGNAVTASLPQHGGSQQQQGPHVPGELRGQRIKAQLSHHMLSASSQAPLHTAGGGPSTSHGESVRAVFLSTWVPLSTELESLGKGLEHSA